MEFFSHIWLSHLTSSKRCGPIPPISRMALSRQEAVATLLHMCNKLGLDNATRFHALCLFADRLLPSLEEPGVHCYRCAWLSALC